jgi:hypothetical protein
MCAWMCRFINQEDADWFGAKMLELASNEIGRAYTNMVETAPLVFCSFMRYTIELLADLL